MSARRLFAAACTAWALAAAAPARAQSFADRIAAVRDSAVRFSFAVRPGVCGDSYGNWWTSHSHWSGERECIDGPMRVRLERSAGQTQFVRLAFGPPKTADASDVDLGTIPPGEAASYLLNLAAKSDHDPGQAVAAAAVADADVSAQLTGLVRNRDATLEARRQALFWTGQDQNISTRDLVKLGDTLDARELREHFTFVLSQRHDDVAIDKLIDLAEHDSATSTRKQAMFWLGRMHDPRIVQFFHDILVK